MLPNSKPGNQSWPGRPSELWALLRALLLPDICPPRLGPPVDLSGQSGLSSAVPQPTWSLKKKERNLRSLACGRPPSLPVGLRLTTEPLTYATSRDQSREVRGVLREDLGPRTEGTQSN
ncbi:hypothetical protein E5288_WYG018734 [Bos mutus]|uniref:Uncharacterized protein n=1 Tax=Bos mutus TaxID=72004 RepID=A0A6B0R0J2_9CETA|nr:hypothetical protein [Bos mutus]